MGGIDVHDKDYVPMENFVFNAPFMKGSTTSQPFKDDTSNVYRHDKDDNGDKHVHRRSAYIHHIGQKTTKVRTSWKCILYGIAGLLQGVGSLGFIIIE